MPIRYTVDQIKERGAALARERGCFYLGLEHMLLGELKMPHSLLLESVQAVSGSVVLLENAIDALLCKPHSPMPFANTPQLLGLLSKMGEGATEADLLNALQGKGATLLTYVLAEARISEPSFWQVLLDRRRVFVEEEDFMPQVPTLNELATNLSQNARQGKLKPFVGREKELGALCKVLMSYNSPNPLLVGHPGTGKTALVEGLAQFLQTDAAPPGLRHLRIFELPVSAIMSDTKYSGELDKKMSVILKELHNNPNIVLFIDEIHRIVGAGTTETDKTGDIANMLKPALGRGEIRVIGATTYREYRLSLQNDKAIERRFKRIDVEEPNVEEAKLIVRKWAQDFEGHHGLQITEAAVVQATELCKEFLPLSRLPDSAITILDETCAAAHIDGRALVDANDVRGRIAEVSGIEYVAVGLSFAERLRMLENNLRHTIIGQQSAIDTVMQKLSQAYAGLQKRTLPVGTFMFFGPSGVGKTHLSAALAKYLFGSERNFLRLNMSEYATPESIADLRGSHAGLVGYEKGGLLTDFIRAHPFSVILLDEIEKAHRAVWQYFLPLFDTDAHIMDNRLEEKISARNVVFVMTSNIVPAVDAEIGFLRLSGLADARRLEGGYTARERALIETLKKTGFSAELINRIQNFVEFAPLDSSAVKEIAALRLGELSASMMATSAIRLSWEGGVLEALSETCSSEDMGARPLSRAIDELIVAPLSRLRIEGELMDGMSALIVHRSDNFVFEFGR